MRQDIYSNPIYNEQDLFEALYKGQDKSLSAITVDPSEEISKLEAVAEISIPKFQEFGISISDYDYAMQADWNMPSEYKDFNIVEWVMSKCPEENRERVAEELEAFAERNMIDLLRWLKYFVDTCTTQNILWGVGRGSSVASYVLYLIGVHHIDSIKYNLDWQEFLR